MAADYFYKSSKKPDVEVGPVSLTAIQALYRRGILEDHDQFRERSGTWRDISILYDLGSDERPSEPRQALILPESSLAMKRLFAECLDRQNSHQPRPKPVRVRAPGPSLTDHLNSVFSFILTSLWHSVASISVSLFLLLRNTFKSKITWITTAVFLVALLITLLRPYASETFMTQTEIYTHLTDTFARLKELHSSDSESVDRELIRAQSRKTLAALLPKVQRSARSSDPVTLSLLWITRDYLPELLAAQDDAFTQIEEKIQTHLLMIEAAFKKAQSSGESWDIFTTSFIFLDVIGACAVLAYFGRDWLTRLATR